MPGHKNPLVQRPRAHKQINKTRRTEAKHNSKSPLSDFVLNSGKTCEG